MKFKPLPYFARRSWGRISPTLAIVCLLSPSACATLSDDDREEWTKIETPDELGALSHVFCVPSSGAFHVLGGIDEYREGPFNSRGFSYSLSKRSWMIWPQESGPQPKQNFAAAAIPEGIFIFGGNESLFPHGTQDSFIYSFEDASWRKLKGSEVLSPRSRATATHVQDKIFVFGGRGQDAELNAGLYSLSRDTWELVTVPPQLGTRVSHIALAIGEKIFIWGGFKNGERVGDGFLFDTRSRQWTLIDANPAIGARANARAFAIDSKVYILGGSSMEKSAGIGAVYDTQDKTWTVIPKVTSEDFHRVRGFEAVAIGTRGLLVRGGRLQSNEFNDFEYYFDIETQLWSQNLRPNSPPGTLGGCLAADSKQTLYTLGGIHYLPNRGLEHLEGLWLLKQ